MFEAIAPRRGEVRTRDLRAVYGRQLAELRHVDVVVVAEAGVPVTARLEIVDVACGHGTRRAIRCPACGQPRHVLVALEGALRCTRCHRHRTRHQLERHLANWNRRGGKEEDKVLRLLLRTPSATPEGMQEARRLVHLLLDADRARLDRLQQDLRAMTLMLETRQAG